MAPVPEPQKTPEETIALITEAKTARGDKFIVKVFKRKNAAGLFEWFADLADATAFHISSPEPWIHQLGGGGEYRLQAYHMDATTVPVGGRLPILIPGQGSQYPQPGLEMRNDWCGPRTIMATAAPSNQLPASFYQGQQPQQQVQAGYGPPQAGNGAVVQPFPGGFAPQGYPQQYSQQPSQTDQLRSQLEAKERELAARELRIERERHEREAEVKRAESEQKLREESARSIRELELKIQTVLAATQAPKAGPGDWVKDLATVLGPIGLELMRNSQAQRDAQFKMQLEAQERADKRAAEDRAENRKLLEAIGSKPGMSDETKMLIETLRSQGGMAADFMRQSMDATGVVTKNSLAMIETISSLKFGDEPESPVIQAVREAVSALKHLGVGSDRAARRSIPQQQLPYSTAATQPVPQQIPPVVNPAQVAQQAANAAQPVQVHQFNEAPQQAQPQAPTISLNEARQILNRGQPPRETEDPLAVLVLGIQAHHNPIEIATYFFASQRHPKMLVALRSVKGAIDDLFKMQLGLPWLNDPTNTPYVMQLVAVMEDMGEKLGLYVPEDEDGGDDDDDDQPGNGAPQ